ncbi:MAG: tripartite tricarboxylate transporter substrate binding protein [Burkholderiaceae bacterium]|nr:tripartite tricarboxylate transporter substrate binding protein [Burkholderiaceae bacterium]MDO9089047.1 tripartite tricarboxylate transporter substrate binding protein [Burkholderiaceae bacterium]
MTSYRIFRAFAPFALVVSALCGSGAWAQAYPNKPIRLINPWPAGGPADAVARPITQRLGEALGQPVIMENRPGNNGVIGSAAVAKAAPDGYTLLFSHVGPTAISPALQSSMPYDSVKDFAPITQVTSSPLMLVCRPDVPARNLPELIAYAKANPGKLNYGSFGNGSTAHLAGEMLKTMAGINLVHVAYKGAAPVMTDLLGGQIDCAFFNVAGVVPQIKTGRLRGYAVTTLRRLPLLADYPSVHETLPGFEVNSWFGLMAPAGTPREIVTRLQAEVARIIRTPEVAEAYKQSGLDVEGTTPDEYAEKVKVDLVRWNRLIKTMGIKAD